MARRSRGAPILVALVLALAACSSPAGSASGGGTSPRATTPGASAGGGGASGGGGATPAPTTGGGGTGGATAVAALQAATKNACMLMPVDAVKAIFPKAAAPTKEPEPNKCSMSDGTSVVEITIDANPLTSLETLNPCQPVPGVGVSACLQEQLKDDAYLQVLVNSGSPTAILYVEVAGNDGKSHATDAVTVTKAILASLG